MVGGFGDVGSGSVHAAAIERLAAGGVFVGTECDGGGFCPGEPLDRWVMAVWLVRILDGVDPEAGGGSRFSDVEAGVWWEPYVERLAELGVTAGCATGPERYCPDRSVTRGQMATFLGRAYGLADAEPAGFVDTGGDTHEASIDALYAAGVTAGCGTGPLRYCPQKPVTRAQMATFLLRASTGAVAAAPSPAERAVVVEEMVDEAGGVVEAGGVTVTVPAGALAGAVVVAVREPLGSFGIEVGGPVVELDHQRPLVEPVTVSWDVSHLSGDQLGLLLVVTWDEDLAAWVATDDDYTIEGGVLVARVRQWSSRSWTTIVGDVLAGGSQSIQELFGRRVDAPKCAEGPLPFWVTDTTDPDEGSTSAAIRLCYERGSGETLTMRMANNRSLSQYVYTDRVGGWGEYWLGNPELSLAWYAQLAAHKVLSNGADRLFIPPLRQVRADFLPSPVPGIHSVEFTTGHDFGTFLADALFFGLSKVRVPNLGGGGVTSKIQLFLEVLFECGFAQAGAVGVSVSDDGRFRAAVGALVSCSKEILDPKSQVGGKLRDRLTKKFGPTKGLSEMRSSFPRMANGILAFWEGVGYAADQIVGQAVGDLLWVVIEKIVEGPAAGVEPYSVVSAGAVHTCAIQHDQTVACWGAEDEQFDYGQTDPRKGAFTAVASGEFHTCGVRTNGAIECWGSDNFGQSNPPRHRMFEGVTAGAYHTCGVRTNGTVQCWGNNASGQTNTPDGEFIAVSAGGNHTCGTRMGGVVECWGDTWSPKQKPGSIWTFESLSAGTDYTCGVALGGVVECWGFSDQAEPPDDETFTAVSTAGTAGTGKVSTCGLRTDGSVKCWGGITGELDGPFTAITVGNYHMCAQRPDSTIHCAGSNSFGQLNTPNTLTNQEPTQTLPNAALSPTTGRIAFVRGGDIWVADIDGSSQQNLTATEDYEERDPTWSPDGSRIAYSRYDASVTVNIGTQQESSAYDIWVINADGTNPRQLTKPPIVALEPAWSPDGKYIVFRRFEHLPDSPWAFDYTHNIWLMNADGTNLRRLTSNHNWEHGPAWSPDSERIVYVVNDGVTNNSSNLWVMDRDGANRQELTSNSDWEHGPAWSPDGGHISYERGYIDNDYKLTGVDVWLMGSDGSNQRALTSDRLWESNSAWSPDGKLIAYTRDGIWVMSADGSNQRPLTTPIAGAQPTWSPALPGDPPSLDGRLVIVNKGDPGPTSLSPGLGTACAPDTPTCRYLNIQLRGFDPGDYTVACSHDGWAGGPPATWWTFTVTVGADRTATVTRQCFINFASLTGSGVYVTVTGSGTPAVTSNHIK